MRVHLLRSLAVAALVLGILVVPATANAAPPPNDDFANATVITNGDLPFHDALDTTEATIESGEPIDNSYYQGRTVWYAFTPAMDAVVRMDPAGSTGEPFMVIYRADSPGFGGLTRIASDNWSSAQVQTLHVQAGTTYYIQGGDRYANFWGGTSSFSVNVSLVQPPPNDNFADAIAFTSVPFSDSQDLTAATIEPGEPKACGTSFSQSVWYKFTPTTTGGYGGDPGVSSVNVYTGTSLGDLTSVACSQWWGLAFHADPGKTYYLQVYGGGMRIDLLPPPDPSWSYSPGDPSTFDDVSFSHGLGYWDPKITTWAWDFGDGTTETDFTNTATHRFAADGDYTVTLTVTTVDQRTNSQTQTVHVRTHDVTVLSLVAPDKAKVGKSGVITVGISNTRYPETVQVDLYKSTPNGNVLIDTGIQAVGVMKLKKAVYFSFNYMFTNDDLAVGKVTFQAVATIQGARDALPTDNTATSPPTLVTK
jgi:PKD domain